VRFPVVIDDNPGYKERTLVVEFNMDVNSVGVKYDDLATDHELINPDFNPNKRY
jgi:hypothetical protein